MDRIQLMDRIHLKLSGLKLASNVQINLNVGHGCGMQDTGIQDTGMQDTGIQDTGIQDTGMQDTGIKDTGMQDKCRDLNARRFENNDHYDHHIIFENIR